jgi:hypothetical protein
MNLKIHAVLPGSEFTMNSSLNLLPFHALLNKLFRRVVQITIETSGPLSLKQARSYRLFEEGWLPDILPHSTHQIRCSNNQQLNYAHGEFYFSPKEWQQFSASLNPEKNMEAPFVNWAKSLRKMQGEGHTLWNYSEGDRNWVFFCKKDMGYCEYVMWVGAD